MRFLLLAIPFFFFFASWEPTEHTFRLLRWLESAAHRAGLSKKEVAYAQGLSEQRWARQVAMRDGAHPSLIRAGDLPDAVLLNLAEEICERIGGARVVRDAQLNRLLTTLDSLQPQLLLSQHEQKRSA